MICMETLRYSNYLVMQANIRNIDSNTGEFISTECGPHANPKGIMGYGFIERELWVMDS